MDKNLTSSRQTARVLSLLKKFNNGQTIDIKTLAQDDEWQGVSERTIMRDLAIIKEFFPDSFCHIPRTSKYTANTSKAFNNLNPNILNMIALASVLSGKGFLNGLDGDIAKIIKSKTKELQKCYKLDVKPLEEIDNSNLNLETIEKAIIKFRKLSLIYQPISDESITIKPYKIVLLNENFYLACELEAQQKYTLLRINSIKNVTILKDEFKRNSELVDFIDNIQSAYSDFNTRNNQIKVLLEISSQKARYFTDKKRFLSSQQIKKISPDGSKIISYIVTNFEEIKPLIFKWIPFINVLEPKELKEQILNEIKEYKNLLKNK